MHVRNLSILGTLIRLIEVMTKEFCLAELLGLILCTSCVPRKRNIG